MNYDNKWVKRAEKAYVVLLASAVLAMPVAIYLGKPWIIILLFCGCLSIAVAGAICNVFNLLE